MDSFKQELISYEHIGMLALPSTCKQPCQDEYPGPFNFDIQLPVTSTKNKWVYSQGLRKIYVTMLSKISIQFKCVQREAGLRVRAMLVYCSEADSEIPVQRCPGHSCRDLPCNFGIPYLHHVIRCDNDRAEYHEDPRSHRLSVVVPLDVPHPGTDWVTVVYTFVCKNSCALGMDRRSTAIIFTLEKPSGEVCGRKKLGIRICSCPKRDKMKEEMESRRTSYPGYRPHYVHFSDYLPRIDEPRFNGEFEEQSLPEVDNNKDIVVTIPKEFIPEVMLVLSSSILSDANVDGVEISQAHKELLDDAASIASCSSSIWSKKAKKRRLST